MHVIIAFSFCMDNMPFTLKFSFCIFYVSFILGVFDPVKRIKNLESNGFHGL